MQEQRKLNDRKVENAWALFDWANSAYALVISTAIFPSYFIACTPEIIPLLGMDLSNSALYSFAVAFSYLLIAVVSPLLSGMADYSGKRMMFLKAFTLIGSLSCIALYFFKGTPQLWLGTSAFILATIGFAGGIVFYNAYLPEIVTEDRYDKVSARGYAFGYFGSVLLLLFILWMVLSPDTFGISGDTTASRIGFALVGLWWLGFAQITFRRLPKDSKKKIDRKLWSKGFQEIRQVFNALKSQVSLKRFLIAFFFYSAGVQTVIYLATAFAKVELNFGMTELIIIVLILQIVAIGGAYLFAWVSKIRSNKFSLSVQIFIWIGICLAAYFVQGALEFYIIAGFVGLVLGGIQSISRSSYSKLLQNKFEDTTSYFSFYDVLFKVSIVVGTFSFGFIEQLTGGMRNSVIALALFFIVGWFFLMRVNFNTSSETSPKES